MVSVRSTDLQVLAQENRALVSTLSNAAPSSKNSHAHTPTVNAASSLPVADTILQFLMVLKPFTGDEANGEDRSGAQQHQSTGEQAEGRGRLLETDVDAAFAVYLPPEPEPSDQGRHGDDGADNPLAGRPTERSTENRPRSSTSLLFDLISTATAHSEPSAAEGQNTAQPQVQAQIRTEQSQRLRADSFALSQTSIALMFGLSVEQTVAQDSKPAQNDNRASTRHRQQSPDAWSNVVNLSGEPSGGTATPGIRAKVLTATFTDDGTYRFG